MAALDSPVGYIGSLGARRMQENRADWLAYRGVTDLTRVHGPAGIDIGADTPAEIAVSILAEAIAGRFGTARAPSLLERIRRRSHSSAAIKLDDAVPKERPTTGRNETTPDVLDSVWAMKPRPRPRSRRGLQPRQGLPQHEGRDLRRVMPSRGATSGRHGGRSSPARAS